MDDTPHRFFAGLSYAERPEGKLLIDVLAPGADGAGRRPRPVVLYLHGGGWHEGDRGAAMHPWLNPLLASRGFVTMAPTYRLSGTATWPAPLDDVRDAVNWAHDHAAAFGGDPSRLGIWGFSAGAHLAALAALDETLPLSAAALAACPSDLRATPDDPGNEVVRLLGRRATPSLLAELSPVCRVTGTPPPIMIAHGTQDEVADINQGISLRDALRTRGGEVDWHAIEGASHSWADTTAAGLDETAESFGTLAADFFERTL